MNPPQKKILASNLQPDLSQILINPETLIVEAAAFTYHYDNWVFLNENIKKIFEETFYNFPGNIKVINRSDNDLWWLLKFETSQEFSYHIFKKKNEKIIHFKQIFSYPGDESKKINYTHPLEIKAKDGLILTAYLNLPNNAEPESSYIPPKPLPTILLVHGGPWTRTQFRLNGLHQEFSSQGYAVLSVNFRGSTGFGKHFLNASCGEWGRKMHQDLLDTVDWAINQKIADPLKIGIYGNSYGGYATLIALTFSPKTFACGVDICGPSNLITLIENVPFDWVPEIAWFRKMIGADERTAQGRYLLQSQSPANLANKIEKPLLIIHGANDVRVKITESEQVFNTMKANNLPAIYGLFPNEGHIILNEENQNALAALTKQFLAKHLRDEEILLTYQDLAESSIFIQYSDRKNFLKGFNPLLQDINHKY